MTRLLAFPMAISSTSLKLLCSSYRRCHPTSRYLISRLCSSLHSVKSRKKAYLAWAQTHLCMSLRKWKN